MSIMSELCTDMGCDFPWGNLDTRCDACGERAGGHMGHEAPPEVGVPHGLSKWSKDTGRGRIDCPGFRNPGSAPAEPVMQYPNERSTFVTQNYTLPGGREYIARDLSGFKNDVEGLRDLRKLGVHIALLGDPGSGKTALVQAAFPDAENDIGHDKMTAQDMLWRPRIDPSAEHGVTYDPSPLHRAATRGVPFYFDEFMRCNADAMTPLFSAMDGRGYIVGGNIDGTDLPIADGFVVIGASNPLVRGAFMPEAIASRFHILNVETDIKLLERFDFDERLLTIWRNLSVQDSGEGWRPSIRELLAAQKFLDADNPAQAAFALTGWRLPARERKDVASVVSLILGVRIPELGGTIK